MSEEIDREGPSPFAISVSGSRISWAAREMNLEEVLRAVNLHENHLAWRCYWALREDQRRLRAIAGVLDAGEDEIFERAHELRLQRDVLLGCVRRAEEVIADEECSCRCWMHRSYGCCGEEHGPGCDPAERCPLCRLRNALAWPEEPEEKSR